MNLRIATGIGEEQIFDITDVKTTIRKRYEGKTIIERYDGRTIELLMDDDEYENFVEEQNRMKYQDSRGRLSDVIANSSEQRHGDMMLLLKAVNAFTDKYEPTRVNCSLF